MDWLKADADLNINLYVDTQQREGWRTDGNSVRSPYKAVVWGREWEWVAWGWRHRRAIGVVGWGPA